MPRRSDRAAGQKGDRPVDGTLDAQALSSEPAENGALTGQSATPKKRTARALVKPGLEEGAELAKSDRGDEGDALEADAAVDHTAEAPLARIDGPLAPAQNSVGTDAPRVAPDPGLYAVLGVDPSASDTEIQTTYRRQAARLLGSGSNDTHALKQLNIAYEVLGNPLRRTEYDRLRLSQPASPVSPTPIRPGTKVRTKITRRRRPRQAVQPRYAGIGDVFVVLVVVGLAVLVGVLLIPRLSINLSALNALQAVLPLSNSSRRVIEATVTPMPATPVPTATPLPGIAARFAGTNVTVSNPNPAPNTPQGVIVRLRRDDKPAANFDVWATVQYRTTEERWPPRGAQKTDASGVATITFNIGAATPHYPVTVNVYAQVDDQQLSWSTTFTPTPQ